jgi:Protein of unknown function (DUF742)
MTPGADGRDDPRVVPVYALTGGRTRSRGEDLDIETLVTATQDGLVALPQQRFERAHILRLCREPVSVVEIASQLHVPLGVARVLVSDLHTDGLLAVHRAPQEPDGRPGPQVLERLLAGLRSR